MPPRTPGPAAVREPERTPTTAIELDESGRCAGFAPGMRELFGRPTAELVGRRMLDFVHEADRDPVARWLTEALTTPGPRYFTARFVGPDGAELLLDCGYTPRAGGGGEFTLRAVAPPPAARQPLRFDQRLAQVICHAAPDALVVMDDGGDLVEFNPAAERLFGWERRAVLGRPLAEVMIPERLRERHRAGLARYLSAGRSTVLGSPLEMSGVRADGVELPLELRIFEIPCGERLAFAALIRDLSGESAVAHRLARHRDFLDTLIRDLPGMVLICDAEQRVLLWNRTIGRMDSRTQRQPGQLRVFDVFPEMFRPQLEEALQRCIVDGWARFEAGLVLNDGRTHTYLCTARRLKLEGDVYVAWTGVDLTDQLASQQRVLLAIGILDKIGEAVVILDEQCNVVGINEAAERIMGFGMYDLSGRQLTWMLDQTRQGPGLDAALARGGPGLRWEGELWVRRKDGSFFPALASISSLRDPDGSTLFHIAVFNDISAQKQAERHLRQIAEYDPLTQLPKRIVLEERFAAMRGAGHPVALHFLDLDRFKAINDSLGHSMGDALLVEVAGRLTGALRAGELAARLGGDEFVVLSPNTAPDVDIDAGADAQRRANELRALFDTAYLCGDNELYTTCSVGTALSPAHGDDFTTLLRNADIAMYRAKEHGRNCVRPFSSDMRSNVGDAVRIRSGLRAALERNELVLHFQPVVDIHGFAIKGLEALIRWQHPADGLLLPASFVPVAEDSGLMAPIFEWVLDAVCAQGVAWARTGLPAVRLAVNVSALQFARGGFAAYVEQAARRRGLDPSLLELEITESTMMQNPERTAQALHELKEFGVGVAVDDFGTGYSSLSYLQRLPIAALKVDQSFISGVPDDHTQTSITGTVLALARNLGIRAVAEGVEQPAQVEFLQRNGCHEAQGFLFSRPVTPAEAARLLGEHATCRPPARSSD